MKKLFHLVLLIAFGVVSACALPPQTPSRDLVMCKYDSLSPYANWIRTPSAERSALMDKRAWIARTSSETFNLYIEQKPEECKGSLSNSQAYINEMVYIARRADISKPRCTIGPVIFSRPSFTKFDFFQRVASFGLEAFTTGHKEVRLSENDRGLYITSSDSCETIETVVSLLKIK